ncbi:MAG TPA: sulfite exporter TauE/SafE family protein, partial [Chitinophagales bacterium]|nr:sulfite exporter TauE/SafE family protein [Chitinophagales bacterium]
EPVDPEPSKGIDHIKLPLYAVLIGSFLGLVGAGGGFLMIPALVYFAHLPMRKAIGTSLVLVAANSFVGFLGDVSSNPNMDWQFLFIFSGFSISGVVLGTYLHKHVQGNQMKRYFGWFVVLVAVFMLVKEVTRGWFI